MAHTVTITAKTGPNTQNTAMVFPDVKFFSLDFRAGIITIDNPPVYGAAGSGDTIREYDMTGVTAVADTITAGVHAIVIS